MISLISESAYETERTRIRKEITDSPYWETYFPIDKFIEIIPIHYLFAVTVYVKDYRIYLNGRYRYYIKHNLTLTHFGPFGLISLNLKDFEPKLKYFYDILDDNIDPREVLKKVNSYSHD